MKSFDELRTSSKPETEFLEERFLRKGAGLMYARQSKVNGDAATKHFTNASNHLNRPTDSLEDQVTNLTNALQETNQGFIKLRDQTGSLTALTLVGVLLSEKKQQRTRG